MITTLLAEATAGGFDGVTVGVSAITALGIAIAAVVKAYRSGVQKGASTTETTIKKPVPTVTIREEAQWATKPDLDDHIERTDKHFAEVWNRFESERGVARDSANNLHRRLDKQSEATAAVQASLNEVKETTGKLLDIALNRKPGTRQ